MIEITLNKIIKDICEKYRIKESDLMGKSRLKIFVSARRELANKLKKDLDMSVSSIGFIMKKKDYKTIQRYLTKKNVRTNNSKH
jgi:chromosomal replication initiation ATPase DnaA